MYMYSVHPAPFPLKEALQLDSRNKIPIKSLLKQQYQQIIEGNLQKVGMIKTLERLMYLIMQ